MSSLYKKKKKKEKIKYRQECVTLGNAANLFVVSRRLFTTDGSKRLVGTFSERAACEF